MPDACMIMHELLCRQVASCMQCNIMHETCMNMQGFFPWANCVIHVVNMPRCCIRFWTSRYYSFQVLAMNAHVLDNELNGQ